MQIIQLIPDKKLNYPTAKELPALAWEGIDLPEDSVIVSFRENAAYPPTIIKKNFHACQRLTDLPETQNLVLIGLEIDSPLAPLIFWDLLHKLPVNAKIIIIDRTDRPAYLQREYFSDSLQFLHQDDKHLVLQKTKPLLVETAAGLDRWSFGIPVGPEDATGLNAVVKRILELNIPEKEVILCGRPGANFKYWQQVRIVGEDIPAPPVRICAKKNALAQAARFENICILHDRVFLPKDFYEGIQRFGDFFPFLALQSLYFSDKNNFLPHRYSDYNQILSKPTAVQGFNRSGQLSKIFPGGLAEFEKTGFIYANPCRYVEANYATGSLYICKKNLWLNVPQDESILWGEFEDVEHGLRASDYGIPARINPYIFTQSLFSRPLLLGQDGIMYESQKGFHARANVPHKAFVTQNKPLFKVSFATANKKLQEFITRYVSLSDQQSITSMVAKSPLSAQTWILQVGAALALSKLVREQKTVKSFLLDVEKMLFLDEIPHGVRHYLLVNFQEHGSNAKISLFEQYWLWTALLIMSPKGQIFYQDIQDYFVSRCSKIKTGSFITACWLKLKNKNLFYHPEGFWGFYRAILNSTPYKDYLDDANVEERQ